MIMYNIASCIAEAWGPGHDEPPYGPEGACPCAPEVYVHTNNIDGTDGKLRKIINPNYGRPFVRSIIYERDS